MLEAAKIEAFLEQPNTVWYDDNDQKATWREWLEDVLLTLLDQGEGFSGKRPNCNSGWQSHLAEAFAIHLDPTVVTQWEDEQSVDPPQKVAYDIDWSKFSEVCEQVVGHVFKKPQPAPEPEPTGSIGYD